MKIVAVLAFVCLSLLESQVCGNLYNNYYYNVYYRSYNFRVPTYRRYRYTTMNRLKLVARLNTYSSLGSAFYYHSMYHTAARLVGYRILTTYVSTRPCANFDANLYGDFIGYFKCPLFFEPSNFTYCCGSTDFNYCCSDKTKSNPVIHHNDDESGTGMIIGLSVGVSLVAVGIGIVIAIVYCCCCQQSRIRGNVIPAVVMGRGGTGTATVVHNNQSYAQQMIQPPAYSSGPQPYPFQPTIAAVAYQNQSMAQGGGYPFQSPSYNSTTASYPTMSNYAYPPMDVAYPPVHRQPTLGNVQ